MKVCKTCNVEKPLSKFHKNKDGYKGVHSKCKACKSGWSKEYNEVNFLRHKQYREDNKEKIAIRKKADYENNKDMYWECMIKNKYGITSEIYYKMLKKQNNKCQICRTEDTGYNTKFCIDHCHKTGKVRGLLCSECNKGLGHFKDNKKFTKRATKYLEKHNG